jgi:hypothetical protein
MTVGGFETADGRIVKHGQFGGFPEVGDLEAERQLADVLVGACAERPRDGAHDVSDGGLAQAPVDGVLLYGTGARVALPSTSTRSWRCSASRARGRWWPCGPAPSCACASSAKPPGFRTPRSARRAETPCRSATSSTSGSTSCAPSIELKPLVKIRN